MTLTPDYTRRPLVLGEATVLLARTPAVLETWLRGLPPGWLTANEGAQTWNPVEVVAHLIQGEATNWMPRVRWILTHGEAEPFAPFVRRGDASVPLPALLAEFARLRAANLDELAHLVRDDATLRRRGRHPALGSVTIQQLLAAWVAHDFDHIVQIARVMARQYTDAVGPWGQYLRVMTGT